MATYKNPASSISMNGVSFYLSDNEKLESLNLRCEICEEKSRGLKESTYISNGHIIALHVKCIHESKDPKYSYTITCPPPNTQTQTEKHNKPSSMSMHGVSFFLSDSDKLESLNLSCEFCDQKSRGVTECTYISKGHIIAFHVKCLEESSENKKSHTTSEHIIPTQTHQTLSGSIRGVTEIIHKEPEQVIEHEKRFKKRKLLFSVALHIGASVLGLDGPWDIVGDILNEFWN